MATSIKKDTAPYCMMITFEIAPEDEAEFNDIYDNDHVPTIMKLPGVVEVLRFCDAEPNERGLLVYSAIYFMTEQNLHETPEWNGIPPQAHRRLRNTGNGRGTTSMGPGDRTV